MYALPLTPEQEEVLTTKLIEVISDNSVSSINELVAEVYKKLYTTEEVQVEEVVKKQDENGNFIELPRATESRAVTQVVPVMENKEVLIEKPVLDEAGQPVIGEDGLPVVELVPELDEEGNPVMREVPATDTNGVALTQEIPVLDVDGNPIFELVPVGPIEYEMTTVVHTEIQTNPPSFKFHGAQVEVILEKLVKQGALIEI